MSCVGMVLWFNATCQEVYLTCRGPTGTQHRRHRGNCVTGHSDMSQKVTHIMLLTE
ncbi:hypothetical protein T440DRAFT_278791 [Plenodomus tracheiphilus IPT5]|uniref:Uncharacterized protein n=1 Tax=Plenodomus tracheiphilus IPT5 TaxID=1408161 RepID=A0A6A7APX1_9PLEO|nr:hypothetical protein T440DRAFT_278791 [Plenodomus tracheiphilus IPT5]